MKCKQLFFLILVLMSLLLATYGFANRRTASGAEKMPTASLTITEDWNAFYRAFRAALKRGDRAALRKMMSNEFTSSFGGDGGVDEAFAFFDNSRNYEDAGGRPVNGWQMLNKVLAKGVAHDRKNVRDGKRIPSYIAPPNGQNAPCRAGFELMGGNWRWTYFVCGD
jgi:hypothetical protein